MELRSDEYAGGRPELEQRNWGGLAAGQESRVLPIIRRMLESALQPGQFFIGHNRLRVNDRWTVN